MHMIRKIHERGATSISCLLIDFLKVTMVKLTTEAETFFCSVMKRVKVLCYPLQRSLFRYISPYNA